MISTFNLDRGTPNKSGGTLGTAHTWPIHLSPLGTQPPRFVTTQGRSLTTYLQVLMMM